MSRKTFFALAVAIPFLVLAAWEFAYSSYNYWGIDHALYVRDAVRYLGTGSPYADFQLTGSAYDIGGEVWLYPPTTLLLVLPFVWLPAVLWWAVPLGVVAYACWRWRPSPWVVPALALILAWPRTVGALMAGNTDMWIAAFVAAGLIWGWPTALVVLKPSVAPLLVAGVRSWRISTITLLALGGISVLFLPLWPQYFAAALNARSPGILYSLPDLPILIAPVVAYALRSRAVSDNRQAVFSWRRFSLAITHEQAAFSEPPRSSGRSRKEASRAWCRTCAWESADDSHRLPGRAPAARNIIASTRNPRDDFATNIGGTLNVLMAARGSNVDRVVYTSSTSVYGNPKSIPINEDDLLVPVTPYAVSKLSGEHYCLAFYESYGLPVAAVRYANIYGLGQRPDNPYCGVVSKFLTNCSEGLPLTVHGDGEQTRDFTYIDDAVDATLLAATHPRAEGDVFNVGTRIESRSKPRR